MYINTHFDAEFTEHMFRSQREFEQNMISQLMEAINALCATDAQAQNGGGINITV